MTLKIVADENIPLAEEFFTPLGQLVRLPGRTMTAEDVRDADALIVRSVTPVNESLLLNSKVKFVGTCTIGTDHLDLDYLQAESIAHSSAPGCNANSVVEYVFSTLCALDIDWRSKRVGIIGCGNVGGHLYRRLREFSVDCLCYDPFLSEQNNADLADLNSVLDCDIVCLHTPLTVDGPHPSKYLLSTDQLLRLKPGAVLINAGRGPVIDNEALLSVLKERSDFKVVLDVWEGEPSVNTELLARVDLASPHIAGYSYDGKVAGTEMIYRALCSVFNLEPELSADSFLRTDAEELPQPSTEREFDAIKTAVLGAYDVRADDARMRQQLADVELQERLKRFDLMRKNYPERREFGSFSTFSWPQIEKKPLNNVLATLGFCTGFSNIENGCKHSK